MTRDPFALWYLRTESLRLSADYELLVREFEGLAERPFDLDAHAAWRRKLRHFRGLLANHKLACEWMRYPPCGANQSGPLYFCAVPAPRTDFAVGVEADSR